jgi:LuxR family maltose regulon positive regulatory protein
MRDNPRFWIDCCWRDFLAGDAGGLKESLKGLREALPRIERECPEHLKRALFAFLFDQGCALEELAQFFSDNAAALKKGAPPVSITQNLPFIHRGVRDFSPLAKDLETAGQTAEKFADALGNSFTMVKAGVLGGLLYERNDLTQALELARIWREAPPDSSPHLLELGFSLRMLEAAALDAMEDDAQAESHRREIEEYLDRERAFYLYPNFKAYAAKLCIQNGSKNAAREWLSNYFVDEASPVDLFRITQHLTTARALMLEEKPEVARAFINSLIRLASSFERRLDRAEALILLGILEWHRGARKNAVKPIEGAILLLQEYRFIMVFAEEGAAVLPMVKKLMTVSSRRDYSGSIDPIYLKELYLAVYARAKRHRGISSSMKIKPIKLSRQQKLMVKLLSQGYRNSDIAAETGLTMNTIKVHTALTYKKLGVNNAADAVFRARELGLLEGVMTKEGEAPAEGPADGRTGSVMPHEEDRRASEETSDVIHAERKGLARGLALGFEKGRRQSFLAVAKSMLSDSMPVDLITMYTGLTENEIESIRESL